MEWPDIDYIHYTFVTEPTQQNVWKRSLQASLSDITAEVPPAMKDRVRALLQKLKTTETWHKDFRSLHVEFMDILASVEPEQALDMAQAGIDALHELLLFRVDEQTIVPAKDVFVLTSSFAKLETKTLLGSKAPDIDFQFGLANPVAPSQMLYGREAIAQIDAWYDYGIMETSASVLAKQTLQMDGTKLPSILSNKTFCLLGCTSQLGPAKSLLQIPGVSVLGIARGGKKLDDLIDFCRFHSPDDTTLKYNPKGANLLTQGPQIAQWILDQTSNDSELIMMPLATSEDGETSVRLAVAMDLIIQRVCRQRPQSVICNYLSPLTAMMVPPTATSRAKHRTAAAAAAQAHKEEEENKEKSADPSLTKESDDDDEEQGATTTTTETSTASTTPVKPQPSKWSEWTQKLTSAVLQPSFIPDPNNHDYCLVNGILTSQPDYEYHVLCNMIKMWRSMLTYYRGDSGQIVAAPYAPLTVTPSTRPIHDILHGMYTFEPLLAMDAGPASTLMASILIAQIQFLNRPLPDMDENPLTLFWDGAVHGGVWGCPYALESMSTVQWALGKTTSLWKTALGKDTTPETENENEIHNNNPATTQKPIVYTPPAAIAKTQEEIAQIPVRNPEEVFQEMEESYGKEVPECVKERLDFM